MRRDNYPTQIPWQTVEWCGSGYRTMQTQSCNTQPVMKGEDMDKEDTEEKSDNAFVRMAQDIQELKDKVEELEKKKYSKENQKG